MSLRNTAWVTLAVLLSLWSTPISSVHAQSGRCVVQDPDCFIDAHGHVRRVSNAYDVLHAPRKRNYWLAGIEQALFLASGAGWYWVEKDKNMIDWDSPSLKQRLTTDAIRFDNNTFPINFVWHPLSGTAFHASARGNRLSLWGAAGYAVGTSVVWEYALEFREKVSINDLIATPVAGVALGEFASRLAFYLHRPHGRATLRQRIAAAVFGPSEALHRIRSGMSPSSGPRDSLGYDADLWHRFSMRTGYTRVDGKGGASSAADLHLSGEFVAIPSYLRPGSFSRFFHDGDITRLEIRTANADSARRDLDLYADTVLLGYYGQRIDTRFRGYSFALGSSVGYRYRRVRFPGFQDDVGIAHLPGLAFDSSSLFGRSAVHLSARISPDFAGIHSWSFDAWRAAHPEEKSKAILQKQGYSYQFGGSALLSLSVDLPFLRVGGRLFAGSYASTQGLDRTQEQVTYDIKTSDRILDAEAFVDVFPIPDSGLMLEVTALSQHRVSEADPLRARGRLDRLSLLAGWQF